MRNPLRDEGAAFQVVLLALAGFGLIALGSWIDTWLGAAVAAVLLAAAVTTVWRGISGRARRSPSRGEGTPAAPGPPRLLVVLSEDGEDDAELLARACDTTGPGAVAHVVVPALDDRARTWTAEREQAVGRAESRLSAAVGHLRAAGLVADGRLAVRSVERAVDDAVRAFAPTDAIVTGRLDEPTADRVAARLGLSR